MFGSKIASRVIRAELIALPEVIAIGVGKVRGLPVLPQSAGSLPGIAFYPEFSAYSDPAINSIQFAAPINFERMRFVIKAMCEKTGTEEIDAVALAQLAHFHGLIKRDYVYNGDSYLISFEANSELLPTTVVDGANFYRQLGTIYDIEIVSS